MDGWVNGNSTQNNQSINSWANRFICVVSGVIRLERARSGNSTTSGKISWCFGADDKSLNCGMSGWKIFAKHSRKFNFVNGAKKENFF